MRKSHEGRRGLCSKAARKMRVISPRAVGYGSLVLLGLVGMALVFPAAQESSSALGEGVTMTSSLNTKTTAYLYSTIALATSGEIDINLVPKANGALEIGTADVVVSTNNTTGYSIVLSTVDQTNKLSQKDKTAQYTGSTEDYAIEPLSNATTKANYLASAANLNTWGYAMTEGAANDNTEYQGLTTPTGETIYTTKGTSSQDSYKLNIAVAVDTSLPAGGYQNGLVVTAVANPIILSGFNQIYYMQDITPAICESAEMESTAQLIDKRDNNVYWVAKLKDGNCWMTQNLALDLSTEVALTPEDSDVTENWTPSSSTETNVPEKTEANYTSERSWNLGKIVLTNPTRSTKCNDIAAGDKITSCQWYIDVSNWVAGYEATKTSSINKTDTAYDAHYLTGNYYTFGAATAGTGIDITSPTSANTNPNNLVNAAGSICPNGWKLPVSGRNTTSTAGWPFDLDDSFYRLLRAYGYPETGNLADISAPANGWNADNGNASTSLLGEGITEIDYEPVFFVRSGFMETTNGILRYSGATGAYRASTAATYATGTYYLSFSRDTVTPSGSPSRSFGYPVRCLAK